MIVVGIIIAVVALILWSRQRVDEHTPPQKITQQVKVSEGSVIASQNIIPEHREHQPDTRKAVISQPLQGFYGSISGALSHSMRKVIDAEKAMFLSALAARLLVWKLDLRRELRRGDILQLVYRPIEDQSRYQIEALRYTSQKQKQTYHFYRYHQAGKPFAAYYDQEGKTIEQHLERSPLRIYDQVTSVLKMRPQHKGVDFKTPTGTKVYMPWRARVVRLNWNMRYNGQCIEVIYLKPKYKGQAVHALFLHLQKIYPAVRPGAIIPEGTLIALSGNTGRSTAPHLHYQLETPKRQIIDPFNFHKTYRPSLPADQMVIYQTHRKQLDQDLDRLAAPR
jgi:murein DD-endopeptidase MepM/ murein hydrolase activator NlpD